jgi:metallo-beta-lactamase family protein
MQTENLNIMVDCGLSQGNDSQLPMKDWPVKSSEIDFLFLTHAHIDHIGRLPELIEGGFNGEIICTHPTKALLVPMLDDAMGFSERADSEIEKLKTIIDELSWGFEYNQNFSLKNHISFKLKNAGHILGSCFIRIESASPGWSVIFSGDIGAVNTPILPDPESPESCDLLILESTYGDRLHEDRTERIRRLGNVLTRAVSDGGKVFIPAFALGRTQELIYEMDRLFSDSEYESEFPQLSQNEKIPVFIDSPMGLEITKIYSGLSDFWDKEARSIFYKGDHPIDFSHLYAVKNHKDHKKLLEIPGPAIILAGSGMCSGGRIMEHLENGLEFPENDIFFVGYQSKGTTGRYIQKYGNKPDGYVYINGSKVKIKATVHKLTGYSAHADQKDLVDWVNSMSEKPGKIKLVHGDNHARHALSEVLKDNGYYL